MNVSNGLGFYTPNVTYLHATSHGQTLLASFLPVSGAPSCSEVLRQGPRHPQSATQAAVFSSSFSFSSLSWSALLGGLTGSGPTSRHTSEQIYDFPGFT